MANNSFLLKGWSVTIIGGLLALSFKETERLYVAISLTILFFFWLMDGYYLFQERGFIKLYDQVRKVASSETDFSMDTRSIRSSMSWSACAFSKTISLFYGGLLMVHFFIYFVLQ